MYVIFPADEVVYLSYGRLIIVPNSRNSVQEDAASRRTSDNPSVPSTSSTRSFHSVVSGPSLGSYSEDPPEARLRQRDVLGDSPQSKNPPVKPSRTKKTRIVLAEEEKDDLSQRSNSKSPKESKGHFFDSLLRRSSSKSSKDQEEAKSKPVQRSKSLRTPAELQESSTKDKRLDYLQLPSPTTKKPASFDFEEKNKKGADHLQVPSSSQTDYCLPSLNTASSNTYNSIISPNSRKYSKEEKNTVRKVSLVENHINIEPHKENTTEGSPSTPISPRVHLARTLDIEKAIPGNVNTKPKAPRRTKGSKLPLLEVPLERENTPVNSARTKNEFEFPGGQDCRRSVKGASPSDSRLQQQTAEKSPQLRKSFFGSVRGKRTPPTVPKMASNESPLRDLTHPTYNEALKAHNAVTFKLVRTVSDFTQQLGQIYEQHAEELQLLVSNFKKKNQELRKERPACPSSLFHTWETLLQEVEIDSQALGDIASILGRQVSRPLLERSFCRKIQSRKVFNHRESYETIVTKTEEKLAKCRQEYKTAYLAYLSAPTTESLSAYFNNHNAYVQQLHATNGMLEEYGKETLPQLLQEIDEIYTDLCSSVSEAVLQGAEVVSTRANERYRRYESLISQCRAVSGSSDLAHLARSLPAPAGRGLILRKPFVAPQPPGPDAVDGIELPDLPTDNIPPPLKDELVIDRLSAVQVQPAHDALKKESADLEAQIRQIHDSLETLLRIQQRSLESALFNKANELQEDISMKRFDLRVAQMHLSAINSQKELFLNKLESTDSGRERKMSSVSTGSMKNKWLKAFKSLKTPPPSASPKESEKKNGSTATRDIPRTDPDAHVFQEYTYKKITPCDVCSQILRGHTRQGLKCRFCKMNVHVDCQDKAPKCQPKSRLLRRQKSTSEIESRVPEPTLEEESGEDTFTRMATINRQLSIRDNSLAKPQENLIDRRRGFLDRVHSIQGATNADTTSMRRRLFAGMKSLTGFGSRSRQGSPSHRSISLPEKRNSQDASGTRPFGEPLCLIPQIENGNGRDVPLPPPSPSPSKGKSKKSVKIKK